MDWYISRKGQTIGPYRWEELQELARSGQIDPSDPVKSDQMSQWVTASDLPGFLPSSAGAGGAAPAGEVTRQAVTKQGNSWKIPLIIGGTAAGLALVGLLIFFFTSLLSPTAEEAPSPSRVDNNTAAADPGEEQPVPAETQPAFDEALLSGFLQIKGIASVG